MTILIKTHSSSAVYACCMVMVPCCSVTIASFNTSRACPYYRWFTLCASLTALIARFMGPTWGPSGADRTQVGPMLASWTLLSGSVSQYIDSYIYVTCSFIITFITRGDESKCQTTEIWPTKSWREGQCNMRVANPQLWLKVRNCQLACARKSFISICKRDGGL